MAKAADAAVMDKVGVDQVDETIDETQRPEEQAAPEAPFVDEKGHFVKRRRRIRRG